MDATPAVLNTPATGWAAVTRSFVGPAHNLTADVALTAGRRLWRLALATALIAVTPTGLDFVLPPEQDRSQRRMGDRQPDRLAGRRRGDPTVEAAAAHTGLGGLRLISPLASGPEPLWQITQTVSLPAGIIEPTLSWLTRVVSGDGAESLLVEVSNGSTAITHTIPLAPIGWTHAWKDLSAFSGQAVTLRIGFQGTTAAREVHLDEISIGATRRGSYPVYLPLISRR